MKMTAILTTTAAAIAATATVAQDSYTPGAVPEFDSVLNDLIGAQVSTAMTEDNVASIHDILLLPEEDRQMAVLSMGGLLGVGDKFVAVPFEALERDADAGWTIPATEEQLAARASFSYDAPTARQFAPLGFGTEDPVSQERDGYLDTWSQRMGTWSRRVEAEAGEFTEQARSRAMRAWGVAEREWRELRASSAENWDAATAAFEDSVASLEEVWNDGAAESTEAATQ